MENENPITYPLSDDLMFNDYTRHRYVLTEKAVLDELGIDLKMELNSTGDANPGTLPQRWLVRVSNAIYHWIYEQGMSNAIQEYLLAKYPPLRERVYRALLEQVLYNLENGFLGNYSGVNVVKNTTIDFDYLRGDLRIAAGAVDELTQILPCGFSIVYRGNMGYLPCNYREGY